MVFRFPPNNFKTILINIYLHGGYLLDVPFWKDTGLCFAKSAEECFVIWLKKRMPKVSIHIVGNDGSFDVLDTKYLVYPRCDFDRK